MELTHIIGNTYCLVGWSYIPLYMLSDGECILIDCGLRRNWDELRSAIEANKLHPRALICTHMHLDHTGCAAELKECFGTDVYLPAAEMENVDPDTRPDSLSSAVTALIPSDSTCIEACSVRFEIVRTLHGHTNEHCGYITPDGVFCVGDTLMAGHTLESAKLPYTIDFDADIAGKKSMNAYAGLNAYIFSHEGILTDSGSFLELVDLNVEIMEKSLELILDCTSYEYSSTDSIIHEVMQCAGVPNIGTRIIPVSITVEHALESFAEKGLVSKIISPEGTALYRRV